MELEEMKALWGEMSVELDKQKALTDSLVIKMTEAGYRDKINKVFIPELAGSAVCAASVLYIVINFQKLNTWYLIACGVSAVLILLALPTLSLKAIKKLNGINISRRNYKQSLAYYTNAKKQFVFAQKLTFYLGPLLILAVLPVMTMLIGDKDFFKVPNTWMIYPLSFPFFYPFAKWVFKSYSKIVADGENILKELGED